jgi:hypothetical protein
MAFKLKARSTVQGTSGHKAALKQQLDDDAREKAADEARKKSASTQELKDYLKEMDELLDKGISPEEAKQMLAEKTAPTKQVKEKEKGSSSDMDKEAADEDAKMIKIAKKRGYTMKLVDGKIVKVPVDKKTGEPILDFDDTMPAPNKGLDRSKAKRNDPNDGVVSASEASGGMFMKSPNKQTAKGKKRKFPTPGPSPKPVEAKKEAKFKRIKELKAEAATIGMALVEKSPGKMVHNSPTKQKSDPRDGNNATYEKKAGVNFQKAKDKIKKLGLTSSDAQFKKIMADARKKNKALADSLRNN